MGKKPDFISVASPALNPLSPLHDPHDVASTVRGPRLRDLLGY